MANIVKRRQINSARLERWLGADRIETLAGHMRNGGGPGQRWYGQPINLTDVPGSVWLTADGDFVGEFHRGAFASAADSLADHLKRLWAKAGRPIYIPDALFQMPNSSGFASISAALSRASQGNQIRLNGMIQKSGPTGVAAAASTLWRVGSAPAAGGAGSAAPGGRAPDDTTTGGIPFTNPSSGFLHLTGADFSASVLNNALMIYDRIFDVAKTMNSTATEAVTGVPTRYQSTTATDQDYAGGNFLFPEIFTALPATAHNWTVCTYADQAGAASTLPSFSGVASGIIDRLDFGTSQWFAPLETGDTGIQKLTQMQCSALVATGAINFVIGHPLGIMAFPVINSLLPFDWLTNREQTPRIFNDACLSFLELPKPSTTATVYNGMIYATSAA